MYFENKFYGKILWWESFFEGYCCQREYRGPTIKKNYNFGETIFFTDFCFPQTKWIRLVSFINVVHKIDAINKNRSLQKLFSKENMFLLNRFEWRSYKCGGRGGGVGYWRPMIEGKNYLFENFFTESHFI